jgi:hypothetical protein
MTLASDIYTILNGALWIIATIPKPLRFLVNPATTEEALQSRDLHILAKEEGTFSPNVTDGSDDIREQGFSIIGMEENETDVGKMIAMIKKCLKRSSSVAAGTYTLNTFRIAYDKKTVRYYLTGKNTRIIEDDAF